GANAAGAFENRAQHIARDLASFSVSWRGTAQGEALPNFPLGIFAVDHVELAIESLAQAVRVKLKPAAVVGTAAVDRSLYCSDSIGRDDLELALSAGSIEVEISRRLSHGDFPLLVSLVSSFPRSGCSI